MKRSLFITIVVLLMAALFVSCNADKAAEDQLFEVTIDSGARTLEASGVLDVDVENLVWFYEATKTSGGFKYGQTTEKTAVKENDAPGLSGASLGSFSKGTWQYKFYGYAAADVTSGVIAEGAKPVFQQLNCVATIAADYTLSVTLERGEGALPAAIVKFATLNWFHDDFKNEDHTLTLKIFVEGETTPRIDNIEGTWVSADGKATFTTTASLTLAEASTLSFRVYEGTDIIGTENIQIAATPGMTYTVAVSGTASGITPVDTRFGVEIDVAGTAATLPITTETAVSVKSSAAPDSTQAEAATTVSFPAGSFTAAQAAAGDKTLTINIMNVEEATNAGFTISNGQTAIGAISLDIDGVDTSDFNGKTVTIETYIAAGLDPNEIDVVYTGPSGDQPTDVDYDPQTGRLSFNTTHFSEYVVVSTGAVAYNADTKAVYESLQAAIDAAQAGETIKLLKDVQSSSFILIYKSLTLDGNNHTVDCGSSVDRTLKLTGQTITVKNMTLRNSYSTGRCIDTRGDLTSLTIENVEMYCTGTGNIQPVTISYDGNTAPATKATVTITDSKISGIDGNGNRNGYAIIMFRPVDLQLTETEIEAWNCLYFKNSSASSTVSVVGGSLKCVGQEGNSNSFGLIVFESVNNIVALENVDVDITTSATVSKQALVVFSEWYGPNTSNDVSVTGGSIALNGENAVFVIEKGAENTLTVTNASGVDDYSYQSPEITDCVAYMYTSNNTVMCDGYYNIDTLLAGNAAASSHWFCKGEWLELYTDATVSADATLYMNANYIGTFGLICGDKTLSLADGVKLVIPEGVTIATDVALDIFSAPDGFAVVSGTVPTGYSYAYTVQAIQ